MPFDIQARARLGGRSSDDLQWVIPKPTLLDLLGSLILVGPAAGALSGTIEVHGFSNSLLITDNTVIGDLVESTFPGYADGVLNGFVAAGLDSDGNVVIFADLSVPFVVTGDPLGQTLGGLYLVKGALFLGGVSLDPALVLVDGQIIPASFTLQLGNS